MTKQVTFGDGVARLAAAFAAAEKQINGASTLVVSMAKKNPIQGVRTFTVTSEADADEKYAVVEIKRNGTQYYCQCGDFFFRRLPFIDTNLFANCKHCAAVIDAIRGGGK